MASRTAHIVRRTLLFSTLFATPLASLCGAQTNLTDVLSIDPLLDPFLYYFPSEDAVGSSTLFPMPTCQGITLEEATIDQLQGYMSDGTLTSSALLKCYLRRVRQVDEYISSIIELNPDAEDIADALDAERAAAHIRGPLYGIPYLIKDNIAT